MKELLAIFCLITCYALTSCEKTEDYKNVPEPDDALLAKAKNYVQTNAPKTSETDLGLAKIEVDWEKYTINKNSTGNSVLTAPVNNSSGSEKEYMEFAFLIDANGTPNAVIKQYVGEFSAPEIELSIYTMDGKRVKKGVYNTKTGKFRRWFDVTKIRTGGAKLKATSDPQIMDEILMECPEGLVYNPQVQVCDFPSEVTDDWASPYFWIVMYDDGSIEYLPYSNELEEVVVTAPGNPGTGTGGGGGGSGTGGGFPVNPGTGTGLGSGSGSGSGSTGGGGTGSTPPSYSTETSKLNFDPEGTWTYTEDDNYDDNGTSRSLPFDFWLEVTKSRSQATGLVIGIISVTPIPKKPIDEYINRYGERVVREITVLPSTVRYTPTPLGNSYLIMATFTVNAVYKYYEGTLCTKIITRQYVRSGSCVVW